MTIQEKTLIGAIDLTPTWAGLLPTLLALYEDGNVDGKNIAFDELARMAQAADKYVASQKGGEDAA